MGIFAVPKILLFLVGESQCFRVFDIQTFGKISCNQSIEWAVWINTFAASISLVSAVVSPLFFNSSLPVDSLRDR